MSPLRTLSPTVAFAFLILLAGRVPAHAQSPPVLELAGGYRYFLHFPSGFGDQERYGTGVFASIAWNLGPQVALVGEFSRSAMVVAIPEEVGGVFGSSRDLKVYGNAGGVRWRFGSWFVQGLVGQIALQEKEQVVLGMLDATRTQLAVQPGAGFDIRITDRVSARIQGDYRYALGGEADFSRQIRVAAGVVVGAGRR